jgi:hypothetical protein
VIAPPKIFERLAEADGTANKTWYAWFSAVANGIPSATAVVDLSGLVPITTIFKGIGALRTIGSLEEGALYFDVKQQGIDSGRLADASVTAAKLAVDTDGWIRKDAGALTARELLAEDSAYDNTTSGMAATDVQAALDEVADDLLTKLEDAPSDGTTYGRKDGAWEAVGGGGGGSGAMELVGTATVAGSAATSLTMSSLDLATDGCYIIHAVLKNATGSTSHASLYFNGDTTATNYYRQALSVNGVGVNAEQANDGLAISIEGSISVFAEITLRRDFDGYPRSHVRNTRSSVTAPQLQHWTHGRNNTANVTSITLSGSVANSLAIGSYFKVFKLVG